MLSVELELTEWTEGKEALGGWDLVLAPAPTDAELLHSEHQTQVIEKHRFTHRRQQVVPEYSSRRKRPQQRWILHCFLTLSFIRQWNIKIKNPRTSTRA